MRQELSFGSLANEDVPRKVRKYVPMHLPKTKGVFPFHDVQACVSPYSELHEEGRKCKNEAKHHLVRPDDRRWADQRPRPDLAPIVILLFATVAPSTP